MHRFPRLSRLRDSLGEAQVELALFNVAIDSNYTAAIWLASASTMWFTEIESPPARL
jgi:hypothetical protein